MNKLLFFYIFLFVFISGCSSKQKTDRTEAAATPGSSENSASVGVKKEEQWWIERHQEITGRLNSDCKLILIGNSIFHSLDSKDRGTVWEKYLINHNTINMGISGDRTENIIWRLENGALDNINPKVAIILAGTNNTDGNHYLVINTPEELAEGLKKICSIVSEKLPSTNIILMGILPYGYTPNHRDNINKAVNRIISEFPARNPRIHYIDIGHIYLDENGKVNPDLMPDYLHPNAEGHRLMFEALEPKITELMAE